MNQEHTTSTGPAELLDICRRYWRRWLLPAAAVTVATVLYAVNRPDHWEATQALFVRNEAMSGWDRPGKFRHDDEMKITQETIMQVALSRAVLSEALRRVGPSADHGPAVDWPSERDVEALHASVRLTPPKGSEFGTTEVFYLKVRDRDPQRAAALVTALYDELSQHLQKLREAKAASMIGELEKRVQLAEADLQRATEALSKLEHEVGSDLAELRILQISPADTSDVRRRLIDLDNELRTTREAIAANEQLLKVLRAAQQDQGQLLATPNRLLESLPALRRLKDGLVDAQLQASQLRGTMSANHPRVRAAIVAEQEIGQHIHDELEVAIRGLEVEQQVNQQRAESLATQLKAARERLDRVAALRADYSNLVASVEHHSRILEDARRDLAEARASQAGAMAASLLGRIDQPVISSKPVGPSRKAIVGGGALGGLAFGLGLLLLTVPPSDSKRPAPAAALPEEPATNANAIGIDRTEGGVLSIKDALRRAKQADSTSLRA